MPNIKSAKKRVSVTSAKTLRNQMLKSALKTSVRKYKAALADGTVIATLDVYVVQIGNTWYVDNLTTNTNTFYAGQLAGIAA